VALRVAAQIVNVLMSYIALARKWRPRTFSQLIGQEHIINVLVNALKRQRIHHAYLFTGTRGVGKTSIARLLAKALNCEQGITSEPCLQCDACIAIEQNRFLDLIEIDGASRTRVEDTREILENVQYAPTNGRFKIYLIDEVHMLSQHSFNALLKTLEEPPAHVKFILATTDPQKLPVTILSRCLQFNLKHVDDTVIAQHLERILRDEQLTYDASAIDLLSRAARGSIRDGLSLLDQAIASSDSHIHVNDIRNCLGYAQQDYALQLLNALARVEPDQLITLSRQIAREGGQFRYVLEEMLSYLHQMSLCQSLDGRHTLLNFSAETEALGRQFAPEDVQLMYQICLKGVEDLTLAPTTLIGFEMTLLRMHAFRPSPIINTPPLLHQDRANSTPLEEVELVQLSSPLKHVEHFPPQTEENDHVIEATWSNILPQLKLTGLAFNAAENAELVSKNKNQVILRMTKGHQSLFTSTVLKRIEEALTRYYEESIKVSIESHESIIRTSPAQQKKRSQEKQHHEAEAALYNDPFFQQLQQAFSAELVKNSIAPVKDGL
jgi:DNA polymerase-3 subunit gamma/tau